MNIKASIPIFLLELAIITQDSNAIEKMQKTKELAQLADNLGYKRFLVGQTS